jgi:hypothetical protein
MASPLTRRPANRRRGGGVFSRTPDEGGIARETQSRPASRKQGGPKGKTAPAKGKEKKKNKKKALKGNKVAAKSSAQKEEESTASLTSKEAKQAAPDLLRNPEAKGRGLINNNRTETESVSRSRTTSRGECSGQKKPES